MPFTIHVRFVVPPDVLETGSATWNPVVGCTFRYRCRSDYLYKKDLTRLNKFRVSTSIFSACVRYVVGRKGHSDKAE